MFRVDLRELTRGGGAVQTQGKLKLDDPALEGVDINLREPVSVTGRLQSIGEGRFYWQGTARTVVQGECRRCLTPVATPLQLERKSTRLNSSHGYISYAVFCLKK